MTKPDEDDPPEGGAGDEGQGDGGGAAGDGGGDGGAGGGAGVSHDDIKQAVREVLAELGVGRGGDGGAPAEGGAGDGGPRGGRLIDEERAAQHAVERELGRLKQISDLEELKQEVKKIVEQPPKKFRRVTTAMWGSGD